MNKKHRIEMIIANIGVLAIVLFFVFIAAMMVTSCAGIRLPDRDHPLCSIPWENRLDCISNNECPENHECAYRGQTIGKCTYIDCCDPWRGRGNHAMGRSWCTHSEEKTVQE